MNIFRLYVIARIEEKQIDANYEAVVLPATLNNKSTNKISVNF